MIVLKPPAPIDVGNKFSIFLAGSIEMGKAEDWQYRISKTFEDYSDNLVLLNPRRDGWDWNTKQSINNTTFKGQVDWELDALEAADLIMYYFVPGTMSPISLLEFGLYANTTKHIIVCCPEGFWRKGNIDVVCDRFIIPLFDDLNMVVEELHNKLPQWIQAKQVLTSTSN